MYKGHGPVSTSHRIQYMGWNYLSLSYTLQTQYIAAQYNKILHTVQKLEAKTLTKCRTHEEQPYLALTGKLWLSSVSYSGKSDRDISGMHCMCFWCSCPHLMTVKLNGFMTTWYDAIHQQRWSIRARRCWDVNGMTDPSGFFFFDCHWKFSGSFWGYATSTHCVVFKHKFWLTFLASMDTHVSESSTFNW